MVYDVCYQLNGAWKFDSTHDLLTDAASSALYRRHQHDLVVIVMRREGEPLRLTETIMETTA